MTTDPKTAFPEAWAALATEKVGSEFGRKDCGPIDAEQIEVVIAALHAAGQLRTPGTVEMCEACGKNVQSAGCGSPRGHDGIPKYECPLKQKDAKP